MRRIQKEIGEYLGENTGIYIFIIVLFIASVLAGAFLVRGLEAGQHETLYHYFNLFITDCLESPALEGRVILGQSVKINLQYLFLIWLSGLFIFGFPLTMILIGWRGFSLGFAVGFLVKRSALRGVLFALGAILPHSLLIVPALIIVTVTGFSFSWLRFKGYLKKEPYPSGRRLLFYTAVNLLLGVLLLAGCLVEAYISPVFMKLLLPYL